jgi:mono/diheme cytochrome c family protein
VEESRQKSIIAFLIMIPAMFIFSSCTAIQELAERPSPKTPELLDQGKKLYEDNCVQCHGPNGDGKGWKAAELKKKPRNFTLPFDQWNYSKGDPKKIFEVLKVGIPDTPMAMFHFTDEQRWALVYRVMEFSQGNEVVR